MIPKGFHQKKEVSAGQTSEEVKKLANDLDFIFPFGNLGEIRART